MYKSESKILKDYLLGDRGLEEDIIMPPILLGQDSNTARADIKTMSPTNWQNAWKNNEQQWMVNPKYWGNTRTKDTQENVDIVGYADGKTGIARYKDGQYGYVGLPDDYTQGSLPELLVYGNARPVTPEGYTEEMGAWVPEDLSRGEKDQFLEDLGIPHDEIVRQRAEEYLNQWHPASGAVQEVYPEFDAFTLGRGLITNGMWDLLKEGTKTAYKEVVPEAIKPGGSFWTNPLTQGMTYGTLMSNGVDLATNLLTGYNNFGQGLLGTTNQGLGLLNNYTGHNWTIPNNFWTETAAGLFNPGWWINPEQGVNALNKATNAIGRAGRKIYLEEAKDAGEKASAYLPWGILPKDFKPSPYGELEMVDLSKPGELQKQKKYAKTFVEDIMIPRAKQLGIWNQEFVDKWNIMHPDIQLASLGSDTWGFFNHNGIKLNDDEIPISTLLHELRHFFDANSSGMVSRNFLMRLLGSNRLKGINSKTIELTPEQEKTIRDAYLLNKPPIKHKLQSLINGESFYGDIQEMITTNTEAQAALYNQFVKEGGMRAAPETFYEWIDGMDEMELVRRIEAGVKNGYWQDYKYFNTLDLLPKKAVKDNRLESDYSQQYQEHVINWARRLKKALKIPGLLPLIPAANAIENISDSPNNKALGGEITKSKDKYGHTYKEGNTIKTYPSVNWHNYRLDEQGRGTAADRTKTVIPAIDEDQLIVTPHGNIVDYRGLQVPSQYDMQEHPSNDQGYQLQTPDLLNAMTLGGLHNLSPTQWARRAWDLGETAFGDKTFAEYINDWTFGNNGIVSNKFAREHPYLSTGINMAGDAAILGGYSWLNNRPAGIYVTHRSPKEFDINNFYRGTSCDIGLHVGDAGPHMGSYVYGMRIPKPNAKTLDIGDNNINHLQKDFIFDTPHETDYIYATPKEKLAFLKEYLLNPKNRGNTRFPHFIRKADGQWIKKFDKAFHFNLRNKIAAKLSKEERKAFDKEADNLLEEYAKYDKGWDGRAEPDIESKFNEAAADLLHKYGIDVVKYNNFNAAEGLKPSYFVTNPSVLRDAELIERPGETVSKVLLDQNKNNYPLIIPQVSNKKALGGILSKNSDSTILADNNNYIQDFKGKQYGLPTVRYDNGGHLFDTGDTVITTPQNYTGYTVNPMYWGNMRTIEGQPITNILGYLGNNQARVRYDDGTTGIVEYPQNFVQGITPEVTVYGESKRPSYIMNYTSPREGEEQPWHHSPSATRKLYWNTPSNILRKHGLLLPSNILDYGRIKEDAINGVLPKMKDEEMKKAYMEAEDWVFDYYYSPGFKERFHRMPELSRSRKNINQGLNSFEYNMGNNDLNPFQPYHLKATKYPLSTNPYIDEPNKPISNDQEIDYPYTSYIGISTPHPGITSYDDLVYALTHELGHGMDNAIRMSGVQNGKDFSIGSRANQVSYSNIFPVFWNSKALNKVGLPSWYLYPRDQGLDAQRYEYSNANGNDVHDGKPAESYADLVTFRKLAEDLGVFDSKKAGQKFTQDMLNQIKIKAAKDKNRSRSFRYRLMDNFSDDDIIWMMNNIAQNQKISDNKDFLQDKPLYGKYGGHLFGNGGDGRTTLPRVGDSWRNTETGESGTVVGYAPDVPYMGEDGKLYPTTSPVVKYDSGETLFGVTPQYTLPEVTATGHLRPADGLDSMFADMLTAGIASTEKMASDQLKEGVNNGNWRDIFSGTATALSPLIFAPGPARPYVTALFGTDRLFVDPNGVQKTYNELVNGNYWNAAKSFAGDVFNGAVAGVGAYGMADNALNLAARLGNTDAKSIQFARALNKDIKDTNPIINPRSIATNFEIDPVSRNMDIDYTLFDAFGNKMGQAWMAGVDDGTRYVNGIKSTNIGKGVTEDIYNTAVLDTSRGLRSGVTTLYSPKKTLAVTRGKMGYIPEGFNEEGQPVTRIISPSLRPLPQRVNGNHYQEISSEPIVQYNELTGEFEAVPTNIIAEEPATISWEDAVSSKYPEITADNGTEMLASLETNNTYSTNSQLYKKIFSDYKPDAYKEFNTEQKPLNILNDYNYKIDFNDLLTSEGKKIVEDLKQFSKMPSKSLSSTTVDKPFHAQAVTAMRKADSDIEKMNAYHDANVAEYNQATGSNIKSVPFRTDRSNRTIKILPESEFLEEAKTWNTNSPVDDVGNIGGVYSKRSDTVTLKNGSTHNPSNDYHEFLHSNYYGETNPEVTEWRINQLVDPKKIAELDDRGRRYFLSNSEFPVHLRQFGESKGIEVGQPYPGDLAFDALMFNTEGGGFSGASNFCKGTSINSPSEDKQLLWKALNGTLFGTGTAVAGYGLYNSFNSTNSDIHAYGGPLVYNANMLETGGPKKNVIPGNLPAYFSYDPDKNEYISDYYSDEEDAPDIKWYRSKQAKELKETHRQVIDPEGGKIKYVPIDVYKAGSWKARGLPNPLYDDLQGGGFYLNPFENEIITGDGKIATKLEGEFDDFGNQLYETNDGELYTDGDDEFSLRGNLFGNGGKVRTHRIPKNRKLVRTIHMNNGTLTAEIGDDGKTYWFRNGKYISPERRKNYKFYDKSINGYRGLSDIRYDKKAKEVLSDGTPVYAPNLFSLISKRKDTAKKKEQIMNKQEFRGNGNNITLRTKGVTNLATVPMNLLDSIAVNSGRSNVPIKTGLGLVAKESTLGGTSIPLGTMKEQQPWYNPYGLVNNHAYFENPEDDYLGALMRKYDFTTSDARMVEAEKDAQYAINHGLVKPRTPQYSNNILADAFARYVKNPNGYNSNQQNYASMVTNLGNEVWGEPQIQQWWNTSGKKQYERGRKEGM